MGLRRSRERERFAVGGGEFAYNDLREIAGGQTSGENAGPRMAKQPRPIQALTPAKR